MNIMGKAGKLDEKRETLIIFRQDLQKHFQQHLFNLYCFNYAESVRNTNADKYSSNEERFRIVKAHEQEKIALIITQSP